MAMPEPKITAAGDLMVGFRFIVTLQTYTFGFQSVSGLEIPKSIDYINEGGVNDHRLMVGVPSEASPTLVFKRGMLIHKSANLASAAKMAAALIPTTAARKIALLAASEISPQAALEMGPAVGTISVYDRYGKNITAMYSFLSLGMINWRGDDLDASSGSVLCEEVTIAHTGLTRLPLSDSIIGIGNVYGTGSAIRDVATKANQLLSDSKTSSNASAASKKAQREKANKEATEKLKSAEKEKKQLEEEKAKVQKELEEQKKRLAELEKQLSEQQRAAQN